MPGPYGFYEIYTAGPGDRPGFSNVRISRPESPRARPLKVLPRIRFVVPEPVPAREMLARYFFFFGASPVLAVFGCLAVALLFAGWFWLGEGEGRRLRAVCCIVPGVVLLHAACLPPLEGADETSHGATIEALLFGDHVPKTYDPYPRSYALLAGVTGHRYSVFDPERPLSLGSASLRQAARNSLRSDVPPPSTLENLPPSEGAVQGVDSRSPLFFRPFALLRPVLTRLTLIDRASAYRLLPAAAGSLLFVFAVFLARSIRETPLPAVFGLIALIPQAVFVQASCSNYAPAIGLGFVGATWLLVSVLAATDAERRRARFLLLATTLVGIPIWPDFILVAIVALFYVVAFEVWNRFDSAAARLAGLVGAAVIFFTGAWAVTRLKFGNIGTRLPILLPRWGETAFAPVLGVVLLPTLFGLLAAAVALRVRGALTPALPRGFRWASFALAAAALVLFAVTPFSRTSNETWFPFPEYAGQWAQTLSSTTFSWDQDFLAFKSFWGVFGWLDGFYPDWIYATARWAITLVFVALPLLARRFVTAKPVEAATLFAAAGIAATLACATEVIRFLGPTQTVGRFILPYYPLILAPILVMALTSPRLSRAAVWILRVAVGLQVWTAIALVGSRYTVGN